MKLLETLEDAINDSVTDTIKIKVSTIGKCIATIETMMNSLEEIAAENENEISDRDELIRCAAIAKSTLKRINS